jgi:hypothetical protein
MWPYVTLQFSLQVTGIYALVYAFLLIQTLYCWLLESLHSHLATVYKLMYVVKSCFKQDFP